MKTSELETQNKLGYTEEELKPILVTNLSMFTQSGLAPTDEPVITYLSKYIYALAERAYEKGKDNIAVLANELDSQLRVKPWFVAVGIGNNELFIYTNIKKVTEDIKEYKGVPIKYKYMGKIKPA